MKITEDCINCAACLEECPDNAIQQPRMQSNEDTKFYFPVVNNYFFIVPSKCNECEGLFNIPACLMICPMNCIIK